MYTAGLPGSHRCRSLLSRTKVTIIQVLGALHLKDPKQTLGEEVFPSFKCSPGKDVPHGGRKPERPKEKLEKG